MKQHEKLGQDIEIMAVYSFAGSGNASVVWVERADDGTWMVSGKRNALPTD